MFCVCTSSHIQTTASSNTQSTATSTATPEGTSVPLGGMPMGGRCTCMCNSIVYS